MQSLKCPFWVHLPLTDEIMACDAVCFYLDKVVFKATKTMRITLVVALRYKASIQCLSFRSRHVSTHRTVVHLFGLH